MDGNWLIGPREVSDGEPKVSISVQTQESLSLKSYSDMVELERVLLALGSDSIKLPRDSASFRGADET